VKYPSHGIRTCSSRLALAPLNTCNKGHFSVNRIVGEETARRLAGGSEGDLGFDVDGEIGSALGPDGGGYGDVVLDGVVFGKWAFEDGFGRDLVGFCSRK
jgi:hypothetical protein